MRYDNDYRELPNGSWSHINPSACPCRGHGWILSDLDAWNPCRVHGRGVPHPEDDDSRGEFCMETHLLAVRRAAWIAYRTQVALPESVFRARVVAFYGTTPETPAVWVDAAEDFVAYTLDAEARRSTAS